MARFNRRAASPLSIQVEEGTAEYMGCDIFVIFQAQDGAAAQQIILTGEDTKEVLLSKVMTVETESGIAYYAGDGLWQFQQRNEDGAMQSVVLHEEDLKAMWLLVSKTNEVEDAALEVMAAHDRYTAALRSQQK